MLVVMIAPVLLMTTGCTDQEKEELKTSLEQLRQQIEATNNEVDTLKQNDTTSNSTIDIIKNDITTLKNNDTTSTGEIETIKETIDELTATVDRNAIIKSARNAAVNYLADNEDYITYKFNVTKGTKTPKTLFVPTAVEGDPTGNDYIPGNATYGYTKVVVEDSTTNYCEYVIKIDTRSKTAIIELKITQTEVQNYLDRQNGTLEKFEDVKREDRKFILTTRNNNGTYAYSVFEIITYYEEDEGEIVTEDDCNYIDLEYSDYITVYDSLIKAMDEVITGMFFAVNVTDMSSEKYSNDLTNSLLMYYAGDFSVEGDVNVIAYDYDTYFINKATDPRSVVDLAEKMVAKFKDNKIYKSSTEIMMGGDELKMFVNADIEVIYGQEISIEAPENIDDYGDIYVAEGSSYKIHGLPSINLFDSSTDLSKVK